MKSEHKRRWGLVLAITAAGAALRFNALGDQSFWFDEAFTVQIVNGSLGQVFERVPETEFTPPFYYLLAWAWGNLFGTGEAGLRSLSALFGTATIPLVYLTGSRAADRLTGLVAALLFAVSPLAVYYSGEARSYAAVTFFCALAFTALTFSLVRPRERRFIAGWAIAAILALGSHYFAFFLIAPQAMWLLMRRRDLTAIAAVGMVALVGLALLPLALYQHGHALLGVIEDTVLLERGRLTALRLFAGPFGSVEGRFPLELCLTVAAVTLGLVAARRAGGHRLRGVSLMAFSAVTAIGVPLAMALAGFDVVVFRNFLPVLVPVAIVAAMAASFAPRPVGAAVLATLVVASVATVSEFQSNPAYERTDWRGVDHSIGQPDSRRAMLLEFDAYPTLDLYRDTAPIPAGGVWADEIVYVLRPSTLVARPSSRFRVAEKTRVGTFLVIRWRSARPERITADYLQKRIQSSTYTMRDRIDT